MQRFVIGCLIGVVLIGAPGAVRAEGPAFDCAKAEGTVEERICADEYLSELDRRLDEVYQAATAAAAGDAQKLLRAEQRGWIKGRNDCWKAQGEEGTDVRGCVETSYLTRISELQIEYRLAPARGPFSYVCENDSADGIDATFFKTNPPTALLERGDREVIVWRVSSGSGSKYEGQDVTFWARGSDARITWLDETLTCSVRSD